MKKTIQYVRVYQYILWAVVAPTLLLQHFPFNEIAATNISALQRLTVALSCLATAALLMSFFIIQFRHAVNKARSN
ncbi:MAG: hypothetical protein AAGI23_09535 [Bacteroidota bacterium]